MDKKLDCPFCLYHSIAVLTKVTKTLKRKRKKITGIWYFYKCLTCKEMFTTTKSDTESLKNFNKKN